jgi:hypothetical protein
LREKAGGVTSVIGAAEAKKLGLKLPEKPATTSKPPGSKVENGKKEEDKKSAPVKLPTKPAIGINKAPTAKKGGKDEGDEDDPIAKSLKEREKAGGVT